MAEDIINSEGGNNADEIGTYGLSNLISTLIHDVIDADLQAADDFKEMIEQQAVEEYEDQNGEKRNRLKTVDYELVNEEGQVQVVTIPYISLLALPSLRISEATFELDAQMKVSNTTVKQEKVNINRRMDRARARNNAAYVRMLNVKMKSLNNLRDNDLLPSFAFSSSTESNTSTDQFTNVKVSIKLAPTVLPNGIRGLLQFAGSNISVE